MESTMLDPTREPNYTNDHDLLIDMRRILIDMRAPVSQMATDLHDAQASLVALTGRVTQIEGRMGEVIPNVQSLSEMQSEWNQYKAFGKWIWGAIVALATLVVGAVTNYVAYHKGGP